MFPERPARSTPPTPWVPEVPLQTQRNVPAVPPSFNLNDNLDLEMMLAGNEFDGLDTYTGLRALDHELAEAAMALCGFTRAATYPSGV